MNILTWQFVKLQSDKYKLLKKYAHLCVLTLLIVLAGTVDISHTPSVWWDEGWTMNLAKNWVQTGQYGQIMDGQLQPPGLSAAFPVVFPIALSFRLFGVGVWQGRLPGVLFTLASFILIFVLGKRLFSLRVAWITLVYLLLMPFNEKLHPILIGRQALGEMPVIFFLLLGYFFLLLALRKNSAWIVLAGLSWGIALRTKAQAPPFWLVSILLPLGYALYRRWWRSLLILLTGFSITWLAAQGLDYFQNWLLAGNVLYREALEGYLSMSAVVTKLHVRVWAVITAVTFGMSVLAGLIFFFYKFLKDHRQSGKDQSITLVQIAIWGLTASWMGWYLLLGMNWPRYLFPALVFGSIFAAALINVLTHSLNIPKTIDLASSIFLKKQFHRSNFGALAGILLIAWFAGVSLLILVISLPWLSSSAVQNTADYLDSNVPKDALIESYESPLFFLSDHRWHYPPDQVHVELNLRTMIDPTTVVSYNPLEFDPDYLVIGPSAGEWHLYDQWVEDGDFKLLAEFGRYSIYQRNR